MQEKILITGGTGFLGTELAAHLVRTTDAIIYVLVRAENKQAAYHRLKAAWQPYKELLPEIGKRIFPVTGDFTLSGLGLSDDDRTLLEEETTYVFHCGAQIGFQKDEKELISANVEGTGHVLSFAGNIRQLRRFVHISTAYVAGRKSGVITEEEPAGSTFSSLYEKSKAQAETLVRKSSLPFCICRPGMIVGNSKTGRIKNFNTIYYVMKLMLQGKLPALPIDPAAPLNLVPVDYVARSAAAIAFSEDTAGKTFHLTCPAELAPTAGELAAYVKNWAKENLLVRLPEPVFLPSGALRKAGLAYNRKKEGRRKSYLTNLLTLLPYFSGNQIFDRTNTNAAAGAYTLHWQSYIDRLLSFACSKNFMNQTEHTVFEQARIRRASKRYPIRYYDITAKGIRAYTGDAVNKRIEQVTDALWAWGIRRGDRVALTGINSVDYLTLEQAIGLIGAVSVPIYYTTPAEETALLLSRSGAEWFFVGDTRMMQQIEQIKALLTGKVRLVSFSAALDIRKEGIMRWKQFLRKAAEPAPPQYPDPEDLATIRYTSGTTGEPKGVMFNYGQLAWMGEVLTNLLSWEDRNRSMRYLSFLPLSHVVEGILASYAPYYVLSKVDFYYLNDFSALTDALPKVRPTVFFSVPRFYEKLWDQLSSNRFGKVYLSMPGGPAKQIMAAALKKIILKKAGLGDCSQLIVGSAPVSEALLLQYRELGIEIHNAYGQTEAPLITINRLGDNVIPTIGTPLPETTVTAESDGELIVAGPQVALGYYGLETDTIKDGVLRTGDLGTIHENGHITLHGRKKEMIVTAYGKNISIPKIEELLRNIPGISQAVLIGENRPYCTALLWTEEGSDTQPDRTDEFLDSRIAQMNAGLSHPEQIRRYCMIKKPLSIRDGELTPNLKVKRGNVEKHFAREIEEMYQ